MGKRHTPEQRAEAVALYQSGMTSAQVAERFSVSQQTVMNWASAAGLSASDGGRAARYEPQRKLVIDLWRSGMRATEIAAHPEVTVRAPVIRSWVANTKGGPSFLAERHAQQAVKMYAAGQTIEEIAASLGRGVNTVSGWLKERDVKILSSFDRRTPEERQRISSLGGRGNAQNVMRTCEWCGKEFSLRYGKGRLLRQMFCSKECGYMGRRDPDKRQTVICAKCGKAFTVWTNAPDRKYCSRECWAKVAPDEHRIRFDGVQFDSSWEALVYTRAKMLKMPVRRVDRDRVVEWDENRWYAPDLVICGVYVEVKGLETEETRSKVAGWRKAGYKLALMDYGRVNVFSMSPDAATAEGLLRAWEE